MNTIEIFALITALAVALKILVLFIHPKSWYKLTKKVWKQPVVTGVVSFILAVIVLYFVLQEITIVQIFAVMLLVAFLAALSMAAYSPDVLRLAGRLMRDRTVVKKAWPAVIIWVILITWVLYVLFV